jgi:hypothetical protein
MCVSSLGKLDSRLAPPAGSGPEVVRVTGASVGVSVTHFGTEIYVFGATVGGCLNLSVTCPRHLIGRDRGEEFMHSMVMYLTEPPQVVSTDPEGEKMEVFLGKTMAAVQ